MYFVLPEYGYIVECSASHENLHWRSPPFHKINLKMRRTVAIVNYIAGELISDSSYTRLVVYFNAV